MKGIIYYKLLKPNQSSLLSVINNN